jgi:hypothetical protein
LRLPLQVLGHVSGVESELASDAQKSDAVLLGEPVDEPSADTQVLGQPVDVP